ncbi:hypothetical protein [Mycobacteroides abscessus]|uniref:hypothetical protein n=1 Tax=Mycobacteroides abscessus TaxID=36809 RepID=UPI00092C7729|nr:hypothetical protein [Mycobacteroides abscessus]MBE5451236.1 hypothetical protein [Mycobacteroides abscessus]MDO3352109.1 hypothetical protein [Mycobacteroides abscessus subsp. abscessus]SHW52475.1 Uncharacterised protein [Mycobacteroides abscessus subsp. abscessus]SHX57909.1 Uncharacterised protein [Mycobacteroides abscessus subsp. abscessus]SHZ69037.1 Uncharacterised protein [Mycobacteroides abscessus subsp. abscessus]
MNKKTFIPATTLAAVAALTLAACGTTTEPVAAPNGSTAVSDRDARRAAAQVAERELAIYGVLGLPSGADRVAAEAAAAHGLPYVFSHGQGCSWVRTWDAKLWRLYGTNGGALVRDETAERAFHSHPGASDLWTCHAATGIPTADDASVTAPYRWTDGGRTLVRVNGTTYLVPRDVSTRGEVLDIDDVRPGGDTNGPTTATN